MMAAMGMTTQMPWTVTDFLLTFAMWAVMMVGMMTPSATPMILIYARVGRQSANQLTIAAQDPVSKIPEYKVCAVRMRRSG